MKIIFGDLADISWIFMYIYSYLCNTVGSHFNTAPYNTTLYAFAIDKGKPCGEESIEKYGYHIVLSQLLTMVSPTQLCWRYHSLPVRQRYIKTTIDTRKHTLQNTIGYYGGEEGSLHFFNHVLSHTDDLYYMDELVSHLHDINNVGISYG